ncbi:methyltransferase [subsurface metagenome]
MQIGRKEVFKYYQDRFAEICKKLGGEQYAQKRVDRKPDKKGNLSDYYHETHFSTIQKALASGDVCLDLGCGLGDLTAILGNYYNKVIGTDLSITALQYAVKYHKNSRSAFLAANACEQPFKNNTFDFVLLSEVIEHILPEESQRTINEIFRILKPGGKVLITTQNKMELHRLLLDLLILMSSKLLGINPFQLKAKLFRKYVRIFGLRCYTLQSIESSGFSEHINVLSPRALKKQIERGGIIIAADVQTVKPLWESPFYRYPFLVKFLVLLEKFIKRTGFGFFFLSNLVFLTEKR